MNATPQRTALIIVDVQKDFCEGGALAVAGGNEVARRIEEHVRVTPYHLVVASRDWHRPDDDNGGHFAMGEQAPDFTTTWPHHCVAGTTGAEYHEALTVTRDVVDVHVVKGMGEPAYSAFEGVVNEAGASSPSQHPTTLAEALRAHGITDVMVVGLALDYCVRATALDASKAGFDTVVIEDLTAAVDPNSTSAVRTELEEAGVLTTSLSVDPDAWGELTFPQRLQRLREEIDLPEGMRLLVRRDRVAGAQGRWYFQVAMIRPDICTGRLEWGYGGKAYLSPHASRSELVQCVFGLTLSYVEHEVRETFYWRKRRVFGPHVDIKAHWDVAERFDARPGRP